MKPWAEFDKSGASRALRLCLELFVIFLSAEALDLGWLLPGFVLTLNPKPQTLNLSMTLFVFFFFGGGGCRRCRAETSIQRVLKFRILFSGSAGSSNCEKGLGFRV